MYLEPGNILQKLLIFRVRKCVPPSGFQLPLSQAKLKEFKRQYVDHAARKLRLIVDMTSANCSHQVQQELSSTFARLCHMVDESTTEMKDLERQMERSIKELEEVAARSKVLKNQSTFLSNKLELFESSYLKTD